ncbi:MAG TPA: ATP-dependent zinc metalloprotease FtsH [bacterium]|nr:ATP-dependent zinc metalloprotease FtsH [bacterium]HQG58369.1 ATP-dependent zinc metalloprotease FtsH [bacterium]HQK41611.1 ATP-dependent zinc metalloprotease FtsH [bacterium]
METKKEKNLKEEGKQKKSGKEQKIKIPNKMIVEVRKSNPFGNIFFYIFLFLMMYLIFGSTSGSAFMQEEVSISDVIKLINEEKVQDVTVVGDKVEVLKRSGTKVYARKESNISFDEILSNNQVDRSKIAGKLEVKQQVNIMDILSPILMFGLPIFIFYYFLKQMRTQGGDLMSFGKSRAKLFEKGQQKITFNDVAGCEEAKKEMSEIVDFLKSPAKYRKLGARIPKGVLLVGPSGVGKTLLARAIAGEADVPFFSVAGSEFMEMLVGVGSSRVRDLFSTAREKQPSLIFIDEIDAIGRQRGMGIGGGHDEREQTLNQILIEMDGFDVRTNVIVIAATNRPDMLDSALVRPGRFDRRITIPLPDLKDREEIIKIHMRGKPIDPAVDVERLARKTVGFSGADIENMLNEAAILTARENRELITEKDLEEASLKVTIGPERRTLQSDDEKRMTAYHEAGHAVVAANVKDMDPVQRVSIVARGQTLGHTDLPPERDRYQLTQTRIVSLMTTMLGGRAAEEIVFKEFTAGASEDIKRCTELARKMVTEYGMSSLGPIFYEARTQFSWLAEEFGEKAPISEEMSAKIDAEISKIIDSSYKEAKRILAEKREVLDKVANRLLEIETIDEDEFKRLIS